MNLLQNKNIIYYLRGVLASVVIVLSTILGWGFLTLPEVEAMDSKEFSSSRIAEDIRVISSEPHSIQHPEARLKVRNYLASRLLSLGAQPIFLDADSILFRTGGLGTISNIYAEFPPDPPDKAPFSSSYLMLIAHYDSCFEKNLLGKRVFSFGAADDGYGVASILELTAQALTYRNQWKQGLKVLFTDAEENHLAGINSILDNYSYIFDNVGCIINIEARGVKGPAYLFETSSGNSRLMDLYGKADNPYTYSMASAVYRILPNYTDFSPLKDRIPGYNFSVLDNMEYYHTDLDNFNNIHLPSIQHYGQQISPMIAEYLMNPIYADLEYMKSAENDVVFTLPILGMFRITQKGYLFFFIEVLLFSVLFIIFIIKRKVMNFRFLSINTLKLLIFSVSIGLLGTLIAYLSALAVGGSYSAFGTGFVWFDEILLILSMISLFVLSLRYYRKRAREDVRYPLISLASVNLLLGLLSIAIYIPLKENFFLIMPIAVSILSALMSRFKYFRWFTLIGVALITLFASSFLYTVYTALTFGSLGIVLFLAVYYVILIVGLFNCYIHPWKRTQSKLCQNSIR